MTTEKTYIQRMREACDSWENSLKSSVKSLKDTSEESIDPPTVPSVGLTLRDPVSTHELTIHRPKGMSEEDWKVYRDTAVRIHRKYPAIDQETFEREVERSYKMGMPSFGSTGAATLGGSSTSSLGLTQGQYIDALMNQPTDSWKPLSEFKGDHTFLIVTNGTPEGTEVLKYKGYIPDMFTHWKPLGDLPKESEG
jgi:hypothetical protein